MCILRLKQSMCDGTCNLAHALFGGMFGGRNRIPKAAFLVSKGVPKGGGGVATGIAPSSRWRCALSK